MSTDVKSRAEQAVGKVLDYHNIDAAEMRRQQLLQTACDIVESEGVEALKPARIGELSGCARTLVYRYFPDRDAILRAITDVFYAKLRRRLPFPNAGELRAATSVGVVDWVAQLVDALFDIAADTGVAAVILRGTPSIGAEYEAFLDSIYAEYDLPCSGVLVAVGVPAGEVRILVDSAYAVLASIMRAIPRQQLAEHRGRTLAKVAVAALLQNWLDHRAVGDGRANVAELSRPG